jgi:hypothetical protein
MPPDVANPTALETFDLATSCPPAGALATKSASWILHSGGRFLAWATRNNAALPPKEIEMSDAN